MTTYPLFLAGLFAIGIGAFIYMRKRRKRSKLDQLKENVKTNVDHVSQEFNKKVHELRAQTQAHAG